MTASDAAANEIRPGSGATPAKRIAIYVVAQNAARSLARVLERIPASVRDRVTEIFVFDAGSEDDTYLIGMGFKTVSGQSNLTVMRGESTGFGANNKRAISHCIERGYDIMVLLHGDGKYAPEVLDAILAPLERGEADAVFGNRFLVPAAQHTGNMPGHKELAMRALGVVERSLVGLDLRDWHCGYRAYDVRAVSELPYRLNSDDLEFDTEITIQLKLHGLRLAEVAVPPYSGNETNGWRGVRYVARVLTVLRQYWLHRSGFREYPKFAITEKYVYKTSPDASHQRILALIDKDRRRILDVGCGAGYLAEAMAVRGNTVVGIDSRRVPGVDGRVAQFIQVDLDRDDIPPTDAPFHFVVLADVLEHVRDPARLLTQCADVLADDGALLLSVPNVAHWSIRLAMLAGRFPYAARGILDRTHLRFFTLASIRSELSRAGFEVERVDVTMPPLDELFRGRLMRSVARFLNRVQAIGARLSTGLFAYQLVLRARKAPRTLASAT